MIEEKARLSHRGIWYVDKHTGESHPYRVRVVKNVLRNHMIETFCEEKGRFTTLSEAMEFLSMVCKEGEYHDK